jgi:hypothetical protein
MGRTSEVMDCFAVGESRESDAKRCEKEMGPLQSLAKLASPPTPPQKFLLRPIEQGTPRTRFTKAGYSNLA